MPKLGINVQITNVHGWGVHVMELSRRLMERHIALPVQVTPEAPAVSLPPDEAQVFEPALAAQAEFARLRAASGLRTCSFPVFHAGGNRPALSASHSVIDPGPDDTLCQVFEVAHFEPADVAFVRQFRTVIAVSRWNAEILRQIRPEVHYCPLGVDTGLFSPGPSDHRFGEDRFVVFSGGKAEYRKGQDLVLAAFKRFQERHSDAVLVAAWHNFWPATAELLARSPYGTGAPPVRANGTLGFAEWAERFGIPPANFIDLGQISNRATGALLRAVDVAVFPNRAEGGTNMVAMECLAAGVPTILSKNSGHLDLAGEIPCFALEHQTPIGGAGLVAWHESSVDEIVARLEQCYGHREMARETGRAAAEVMRRSWGWGTRMDAQIEAIGLASPGHPGAA